MDACAPHATSSTLALTCVCARLAAAIYQEKAESMVAAHRANLARLQRHDRLLARDDLKDLEHAATGKLRLFCQQLYLDKAAWHKVAACRRQRKFSPTSRARLFSLGAHSLREKTRHVLCSIGATVAKGLVTGVRSLCAMPHEDWSNACHQQDASCRAACILLMASYAISDAYTGRGLALCRTRARELREILHWIFVLLSFSVVFRTRMHFPHSAAAAILQLNQQSTSLLLRQCAMHLRDNALPRVSIRYGHRHDATRLHTHWKRSTPDQNICANVAEAGTPSNGGADPENCCNRAD